VSYLSHIRGIDSGTISNVLNKESGLVGVAGGSGEMSELLNRAKDGDGEAKLAIDLYVYRIQKYLAAFDCAAGGAMAFLFGGGVVEHSPEILQLVFASPYFETVIPHLASNELEASITRLSTNQSKRHVWAAKIDEEERIVSHMHSLLMKKK
jgi:acetate kinase